MGTEFSRIFLACAFKKDCFYESHGATKFCEIFPSLLTACTVVKSKGKISQNFVAFSEYMKFTQNVVPPSCIQFLIFCTITRKLAIISLTLILLCPLNYFLGKACDKCLLNHLVLIFIRTCSHLPRLLEPGLLSDKIVCS